ncbi:MAG: hypothetical protein M3405_08655 [Acidobacteriota bacterium]|jgi:uncharacterized protein YoxC|nr:hypothetical protein [Acidobacteriota bacterium]
MELLTWLTVGYLVILVLTLAIGLILILVTLRSVGTKLGQIADGLKVVETQTAPLNAGVEQLNESLGGLAGGLQTAKSSFVLANKHLV